MKISLNTVLIALISGFIGGIISQYFFAKPAVTSLPENTTETSSNPFQIQTEADDSGLKFEQLQQKIDHLESQLTLLSEKQSKPTEQNNENIKSTKTRSQLTSTPSKERLVSAGVNPDIADELIRRVSQQQFRRLELQNLMLRGDAASRSQYSRELRELNKNKISLRSELGDDTYDQYLFSSDQNNRVQVSSVMAGSPAEDAGFQQNDVILYYDNQKILSWKDIRRATVQGEIGSYTSVEILRDGTQMSLMVPRGTLGVELNATQLDPAE